MNWKFPSTVNSVAFLGIDGIGKSTLAGKLHNVINASGLRSEIVSVTKLHQRNDGSILSGMMSTVSDLCTQSMFGFTKSDAGTNFEDNDINDFAPQSNDEHALLAASLVEFSGGLLLQRGIEQTKICKNIIPIYESWAFKHGVKALILSAYLSKGSMTNVNEDIEQRILSAMLMAYENISPDLGIYVTGDPELALKWRNTAGGNFGPLEDCRIIGSPGEAGFLQLQSDTDKVFRNAADRWGWKTVVMSDRPEEENLSEAMEVILDTK